MISHDAALTWVWVEGGSFCRSDAFDFPRRSPITSMLVKVIGFYIGDFVVTQREWKVIMGKNPAFFRGDSLPVECVCWYDAVNFCNEKSRQEGLELCYSGIGDTTISCNFQANGYRLPTEAEWEFAARGGNAGSGCKYAGSDSVNEVAWYSKNSQAEERIPEARKSRTSSVYTI